ncbi:MULTISPECIES: LacI family DNA-binding transcriptional regulator [Bacillaceae]|uniref:LacI family DNA-binding transcriptional regulator n=1 Tax=Bacillaceae TaxID=186817 RepID=UPI000C785007|nr:MULTISPECIES: LacI family DNA-binding transcriptional regulator [Bacillaceae]PLR67575.1 LacI family transcriptional regulator [Bacillus sp. UMB0893]QNG59869.1 LacI family DNA-binding transcriptional regulator [Bacillus sp. PAMC26568]
MRDKKATIRDVAKEAGVSVATISRYLNKKGYVSLETEKRIQFVMETLKYKPNEIARGLARQKTNTIALFIPDIINPFFPELVSAIEREANSKGYKMILVHADFEEMTEPYMWEGFENMYIDGFIFASYQLKPTSIQRLQYKEIPFVIVDRAANVTLKNSVTIDNYKGAKLAVRHLYSVGCRKIIHISGPIHLVPSQERLRGYMETVKQYSLDFIHYEADFSLESGISLTKKAMAEHPDADGFFLGNDLMAIGCLKMLKYLQKRVPEEIAIAGFDGIALTTMVEPEITTVVQPISEIGIAAANKLLLLINGIQDKQESLPELNVTLAARASTLGFKGGANRKKEA